ncbi:polysaccharide deacetylase family protein [Thalassotalea hakodatensis]|uniref:polysaccharide deacetylase family protein n=1 Tax=Thalassotalea hakodatensis TaxID=3030492 RepID=UPI0025724EC0|nr:polysaccharide deacetylase family protein [Thalassotalea hakodatensis]
MNYKALCTVFCFLYFPSIFAKELAITFDDSPRHANGYLDGKTRSQLLIKQLAKHNVPQVAFFSVSNRLDAEGTARLRRYASAGHIIANHTDSHPNINQSNLNDYGDDFLQAHTKLHSYDNFRSWFRFPYLREGDNLEKRNGMRQLLTKYRYKNAYVSLNNYDWYIESLFQQAVKQGIKIDMQRMEKFYVEQLIESITYYDDMAIKHLGRCQSTYYYCMKWISLPFLSAD